MGFWFWFWICAAVLVLGLALQVAAILRLAGKAKGLAEPAKKLEGLAKNLEATGSQKAESLPLVPALAQDFAKVLERRQVLLKARRQRKEQRQRRLVERLKEVSYDERRLR